MDDQEKEDIGKVAGLGGGLLAGARIGGAVLPIPVIGPFAGAVIGGMVGSELGKRVGKAVINGTTAFVDTLKDPNPIPAASGPIDAD